MANRISDIFTESTITQAGATVLNPLKEYISIKNEDTDKLTPENITDTVDSLFFMRCGEKTPFNNALKIQYNNTDREFTSTSYPAATKISVARSNLRTGYYNNPLTWNYNNQGYMSRTHDDNNIYNLKFFKTNYPDSSLLGGYPLSNYNYRIPKINVRIYYLDPTTDTSTSHNKYTDVYDFINNKAPEGNICYSIMLYYTGFSNMSLAIKQDITGTDDGTVSTFAIPYSNNVYWDFKMLSANPMYSTLDFTNSEYFYDAVHIGQGYTYNDYVFPIKPEKILNFIASFGFIFTGKFTKDEDQTFYPIVNDGIITGEYVEKIEDWDSDNSKWNNTDDIERPKKPVPEITGDDVESIDFGYGYGLNGFAKYLYFGDADILKLFIRHLSTQEKNPLSKIVSCSSYPVYLTNPINTLIHTSQESVYGYNVNVITSQEGRFLVGSIDVPRRFNSFLDHNPYSQYEVYIPLCGWCTLPDKVAGRTIYVYMTFDVISTSCRAIVQVNINGELITVAEKTGKLGTAEIVSATDNVQKQAALTGALLSTGASAIGLGASLMTGNAIGIAGSTLGLVNSVSHNHALSHNSFVSSVGGAGDRSDFANNHSCYLKITYSQHDTPSDYNHRIGRPCNKTLKLGDLSGFTQCHNPTITGNMTLSEKNHIIQLLSEGIYL